MTRRASLLCAALLSAFVLTPIPACAPPSETEADNGKLRIVATIFAPYDFARQITGGLAELTMLLPPAAEIHGYEPTMEDMLTLQDCDVFIYVGGESDAWVETLLQSADRDSMRLISLMDCVDALEEEMTEGMEGMEAEHEGEHEAEYDEHVWTSPLNAKRIVHALSDAFCEADAAQADTYRRHTEDYLSELDDLDAAFRAVTEGAKHRTLLFADRFPFRYLAVEYGLAYYAAFPGCAARAEPSANTILFLIQTVREREIPVVFYTESSSGAIARIIEEESGAKPLLLHACHNITRDDFQNGATYVDLMRQNAAALKEALW